MEKKKKERGILTQGMRGQFDTIQAFGRNGSMRGFEVVVVQQTKDLEVLICLQTSNNKTVEICNPYAEVSVRERSR